LGAADGAGAEALAIVECHIELEIIASLPLNHLSQVLRQLSVINEREANRHVARHSPRLFADLPADYRNFDELSHASVPQLNLSDASALALGDPLGAI